MARQKKQKQQKNIIGFSGKLASGKSFLADYLGKKLGLPVLHLDDLFLLEARKPIYKLYLKIKGVDFSNQNTHPVNNIKNVKKLSKLERAAMLYTLNRVLKRELKKHDSCIVEFVGLNKLKIAKKLAQHYFVVPANEEQRIDKIQQRNNISLQQALHIDNYATNFWGLNNLDTCNNVVRVTNDYASFSIHNT